MHCHMFHHTMNHMVSMAGPMMRVPPDDPRGRVPGFPQNMEGGMSMDMTMGATEARACRWTWRSPRTTSARWHGARRGHAP